jgi:activator of HSP90 ATPase
MKPRLLLGAVLVISAAAIGLDGAVRPAFGFEGAALASPISIHQEIDFKASPERFYDALLDATQFAAFSGAAAEIQREAGGAFKCFDGQIVGRNVELVPNRRIVQAWRSNGWPEGDYSIVRFELKEQGSGTRLTMDHWGFPEGQMANLGAGWTRHYWEPLQKYLTR